jgi:hypothetical protein
MNTVLEMIDYHVANLVKAEDHAKWNYETEPTQENWGNLEYIAGSYFTLIELREEIVRGKQEVAQ